MEDDWVMTESTQKSQDNSNNMPQNLNNIKIDHFQVAQGQVSKEVQEEGWLYYHKTQPLFLIHSS